MRRSGLIFRSQNNTPKSTPKANAHFESKSNTNSTEFVIQTKDNRVEFDSKENESFESDPDIEFKGQSEQLGTENPSDGLPNAFKSLDSHGHIKSAPKTKVDVKSNNGKYDIKISESIVCPRARLWAIQEGPGKIPVVKISERKEQMVGAGVEDPKIDGWASADVNVNLGVNADVLYGCCDFGPPAPPPVDLKVRRRTKKSKGPRESFNPDDQVKEKVDVKSEVDVIDVEDRGVAVGAEVEPDEARIEVGGSSSFSPRTHVSANIDVAARGGGTTLDVPAAESFGTLEDFVVDTGGDTSDPSPASPTGPRPPSIPSATAATPSTESRVCCPDIFPPSVPTASPAPMGTEGVQGMQGPQAEASWFVSAQYLDITCGLDPGGLFGPSTSAPPVPAPAPAPTSTSTFGGYFDFSFFGAPTAKASAAAFGGAGEGEGGGGDFTSPKTTIPSPSPTPSVGKKPYNCCVEVYKSVAGTSNNFPDTGLDGSANVSMPEADDPIGVQGVKGVNGLDVGGQGAMPRSALRQRRRGSEIVDVLNAADPSPAPTQRGSGLTLNIDAEGEEVNEEVRVPAVDKHVRWDEGVATPNPTQRSPSRPPSRPPSHPPSDAPAPSLDAIPPTTPTVGKKPYHCLTELCKASTVHVGTGMDGKDESTPTTSTVGKKPYHCLTEVCKASTACVGMDGKDERTTEKASADDKDIGLGAGFVDLLNLQFPFKTEGAQEEVKVGAGVEAEAGGDDGWVAGFFQASVAFTRAVDPTPYLTGSLEEDVPRGGARKIPIPSHDEDDETLELRGGGGVGADTPPIDSAAEAPTFAETRGTLRTPAIPSLSGSSGPPASSLDATPPTTPTVGKKPYHCLTEVCKASTVHVGTGMDGKDESTPTTPTVGKKPYHCLTEVCKASTACVGMDGKDESTTEKASANDKDIGLGAGFVDLLNLQFPFNAKGKVEEVQEEVKEEVKVEAGAGAEAGRDDGWVAGFFQASVAFTRAVDPTPYLTGSLDEDVPRGGPRKIPIPSHDEDDETLELRVGGGVGADTPPIDSAVEAQGGSANLYETKGALHIPAVPSLSAFTMSKSTSTGSLGREAKGPSVGVSLDAEEVIGAKVRAGAARATPIGAYSPPYPPVVGTMGSTGRRLRVDEAIGEKFLHDVRAVVEMHGAGEGMGMGIGGGGGMVPPGTCKDIARLGLALHVLDFDGTEYVVPPGSILRRAETPSADPPRLHAHGVTGAGAGGEGEDPRAGPIAKALRQVAFHLESATKHTLVAEAIEEMLTKGQQKPQLVTALLTFFSGLEAGSPIGKVFAAVNQGVVASALLPLRVTVMRWPPHLRPREIERKEDLFSAEGWRVVMSIVSEEVIEVVHERRERNVAPAAPSVYCDVLWCVVVTFKKYLPGEGKGPFGGWGFAWADVRVSSSHTSGEHRQGNFWTSLQALVAASEAEVVEVEEPLLFSPLSSPHLEPRTNSPLASSPSSPFFPEQGGEEVHLKLKTKAFEPPAKLKMVPKVEVEVEEEEDDDGSDGWPAPSVESVSDRTSVESVSDGSSGDPGVWGAETHPHSHVPMIKHRAYVAWVLELQELYERSLLLEGTCSDIARLGAVIKVIDQHGNTIAIPPTSALFPKRASKHASRDGDGDGGDPRWTNIALAVRAVAYAVEPRGRHAAIADIVSRYDRSHRAAKLPAMAVVDLFGALGDHSDTANAFKMLNRRVVELAAEPLKKTVQGWPEGRRPSFETAHLLAASAEGWSIEIKVAPRYLCVSLIRCEVHSQWRCDVFLARDAVKVTHADVHASTHIRATGSTEASSPLRGSYIAWLEEPTREAGATSTEENMSQPQGPSPDGFPNGWSWSTLNPFAGPPLVAVPEPVVGKPKWSLDIFGLSAADAEKKVHAVATGGSSHPLRGAQPQPRTAPTPSMNAQMSQGVEDGPASKGLWHFSSSTTEEVQQQRGEVWRERATLDQRATTTTRSSNGSGGAGSGGNSTSYYTPPLSSAEAEAMRRKRESKAYRFQDPFAGRGGSGVPPPSSLKAPAPPISRHPSHPLYGGGDHAARGSGLGGLRGDDAQWQYAAAQRETQGGIPSWGGRMSSSTSAQGAGASEGVGAGDSRPPFEWSRPPLTRVQVQGQKKVVPLKYSWSLNLLGLRSEEEEV